MNVYQYNDNLIYVGQTECQRNPLRREEFLIPRNCTEIVPPTFDPYTHYIMFVDNNWAIYEFPKQEETIDPLEEIRNMLKNPTREDIKEIIIKLTRIL